MLHGCTTLSVIPLRKEPSDTSEMVSQVLFGEHFTIIEKHNQWLYIRLVQDNYSGWIDKKCCVQISPDEFEKFKNSPKTILSHLFEKVSHPQHNFYIPMGSVLPHYESGQFYIQNLSFSIGHIAPLSDFNEAACIAKSQLFLHVPYLWGGKTMFGIDCSGFTQIIMQQFGVQLYRDAYQQATQGEFVNFVTETQTGDLAFFDNEQDKITHVGIVLPDNRIIHASGKVRIDLLDDTGIFNTDLQQHTHRLRIIKRFF